METSSPKRVTFRDLVEEAKKRVVILAICVVGLSYLMSLTSSSVLVNLPIAASLIILLRYFAWDFEMQRKAATYNSKPASANITPKKPPEPAKVAERSDWKKKVNSPVVEDAIDHFTRHLVSEWVTDLWYSKVTPDEQCPAELVQIINGVLGEFSGRFRNINLIDLLTRDLINLMCNHIEHFRANQAKIEKQQSQFPTIEYQDIEIRRILAAENRLHPALFSAEAEHKVLQHLIDGLLSYTFTREDLQCSFFHYIVRELLACAVLRPILNLASPRFLNESIESVVVSVMKAKGVAAAEDASQCKPKDSSRTPSDHFSRFPDPSITGVELVPLKANKSKATAPADNLNGTNLSKDPLLSMVTQSSCSGGEWGDVLDIISRRKTEVLAPENFENMWTKGRNYKKKEGKNRLAEQLHQLSSKEKSLIEEHSKVMTKSSDEIYPTTLISTEHAVIHSRLNDQHTVENSSPILHKNTSNCSSIMSYQEDGEHNLNLLEEVEFESSGSYTSEDEEIGNVTGLDSPVTRVWDGKSNRNMIVTRIHHPLENPKKISRAHVQYQRLVKTPSGRKRSRLNTRRLPVWQEVEKSSFLSGDGQDILCMPKADDSTDDSETGLFCRVYSGAAASSSAASITVNPIQNSLMVNSFYKLRCEVLGANIVKSGSKLFAVYAISVTDVNNNSWSIKRRFRHFEELHRRLKQFSEYNLHLPPKHFLSTGLDVPVIQGRCKLLDEYLKNLLQLPKISGSIEVWDFLSVDSQTYLFSNSFSIVQALSVNLDKPSEKCKEASNLFGPGIGPLLTKRDHGRTQTKEPALQRKPNLADDGLRKRKEITNFLGRDPGGEYRRSLADFSSSSDTRVQNTLSVRNNEMNIKGKRRDGVEDSSEMLLDAATVPALPTEWVPPNLTIPILDLVDVIFQLQEGGWIRRKAFWVVKQILQLGMGDALDDWLLDKIQLLRMGSVVALGIKRIEQILWPDGFFITKHPKRQQQSSGGLPQSSPRGQQHSEQSSPRLTEEKQQEADRHAKFVYELMMDNAPAAVVGLVGRKDYEQCAKDLYYFLQSSVCLKQLAYDLLELLLLSAFPEMDCAFKQLHEEKHRFGEFIEN